MRQFLQASIVVLGILGAGARPAAGQSPAVTDSLRAGLVRIAARLDSLERGICPPGPALAAPVGADSLSQALARVTLRLERLVAARCAISPAPAAAPDTAGDELAALRAAAVAAAAGPGAPAPRDSVTPAAPTPFVGRQRNGSALNPEISATGDIGCSPPATAIGCREMRTSSRWRCSPPSIPTRPPRSS